ncbi:MAG: tripartite tricarboxylate transporter substrate-binding protein [Betaproteobacteria bacterium]|nr:tripartite tricarboxylate transporter substrate-binding protein [Betaproteobacteria bacterium]MDH3438062.1 tripartite tricarboxylate transporter substrate-binding protein [Betaproteobacteria bacterium]
MKSCFRIVVPAILAAFFFPIATIAHAAYPDKPVRVLVVFPPGGSNDVTARIVFRKVEENMKKRFTIENRGGAAGSMGAAIVAKSPADGYTVMVQSTTHIANAFMYKGKLPYDTLGDFIGLTPLARQVGVLVVHPSLPVKSIPQLIALAKKQPGELNYGTAGLGSFVHLNCAMFVEMSGTNMVHVPYRGGGPSSVALISGETELTIATIGSMFRHIKAKRVRPLGVTSKERSSKFPNLPAIGEFVPGFEFTAWVGAFVPAGTPQAIVTKLNLELKKALSDPKTAKLLTDVTLDPMYMTPDQFAVRLKSDYARYEGLMKKIGVIE